MSGHSKHEVQDSEPVLIGSSSLLLTFPAGLLALSAVYGIFLALLALNSAGADQTHTDVNRWPFSRYCNYTNKYARSVVSRNVRDMSDIVSGMAQRCQRNASLQL